MNLNKLITLFFLTLSFVTPTLSQSTTPTSYTPVPVFSDAELEVRVKNLSSLAVTPQLDNIVKSYIKTYSVRKRDRTEKMLGRIVMYFPIFEKYLLEQNMPSDIKYLSVVESALNPHATSRVGAAGLWQFMPATGKEYGLSQNSRVDERRDPHKSTKAAIKYLKRLHNKYQDWELALAAYNSGPGRVNRAIRRGKSKDFWKIKKYLPKETRNYVPAFVAANYIVNNYHLHYLSPQFPEMDVQMTDYTKVYNSISFREISEITGTPLHLVEQLNPSFKQGIIPTSRNGHFLTLPKRNMPLFLAAFPTPDSNPSITQNLGGRTEFFKSVYYVQKGDHIDKLAKLFNCDRQHIMAWNNLPQPYLTRGQELTIFQISNSLNVEVKELPARKQEIESPKLKEETILSNGRKRTIKSQRVNVKKEEKENRPQRKISIKREEYIFHTIRRNESILEIVEKFPGVTIQDILRLNEIDANDFPSVGTRLKIKKK
ncbi:MAG: transglycosylase SLT domain-containing protein [Saprospiraceae bacterium]